MNDAAIWPASVLMPHDPSHQQLVEQLLLAVDRLRPSTKGLTNETLQRENTAAVWLVEALFQAATSLPEVALALPRTPKSYGNGPDHWVPLSFHATTRVLDALQSLGWVRCEPGFQTKDSGKVSRYWAEGYLLAYCRTQGQQWRELIPPRPESLILMTDKRNDLPRRFVTDGEGADVAAWRTNLLRINEVLLSKCIMLDATNDLLAEAGSAAVKKQQQKAAGKKAHVSPVRFANVTLRRIFARGRLDYGGRFYGPWWQNLPGKYRRNIVIDREPAAECDYSGMALRCLYAREGLDIGPDDPYDIGLPNYNGRSDPRRAIVKEYINAALNDVDNVYRVGRDELQILGLTDEQLRAKVAARHKPVAHHFHTGVGLSLQFTDSQIAEAVMLRFAERDEAILPIHDSFIVRVTQTGFLQAAMEEEFQRITGQKAVLTTEFEFGERRHSGPIKPVQVSGTYFDKVAAAVKAHHDACSIAQGYMASWMDATWDEYRWRAFEEAMDREKDRQAGFL